MFQEPSPPLIPSAKRHNAARTMHVWLPCLRIRQPSGVAPLATSQTALWPWECAPSKAKSVEASTVPWASVLSRPVIPKTSTFRWGWVRLAPLRLKPSAVSQSSNPSLMSLALTFRLSSMMMMTLTLLLQRSKLNKSASLSPISPHLSSIRSLISLHRLGKPSTKPVSDCKERLRTWLLSKSLGRLQKHSISMKQLWENSRAAWLHQPTKSFARTGTSKSQSLLLLILLQVLPEFYKQLLHITWPSSWAQLTYSLIALLLRWRWAQLHCLEWPWHLHSEILVSFLSFNVHMV
jgi:hypothetical protein